MIHPQKIVAFPAATAVDEHAAAGLAAKKDDPATALTARLFRYADTSHPAMATLMELGTCRRRRLFEAGTREKTLLKELAFFRDLPKEMPEELPRPPAIDPDAIVMPDLKLPSPPQVYAELQQAIADPHMTSHDLGCIVSQDVGLTARMLKLVNSAYFSAAQKVDSIDRAVAMLGTQQVSLLAAAMCVMNEFKSIPKDLVDLQSFWLHSLATGVLARLVAQRVNLHDAEYYFLAGLLHDIGRLTLFQSRPDLARKALTKARERQMFLHYAEQEEIGYDHSTLGSVLFRKWELPPQLRMTVLYHHIPDISEQVVENAVIHVADIMAHALGFGISGEYFMPPLSEPAWEELGLTVEDLPDIAEQAEEVLMPMFKTLQ